MNPDQRLERTEANLQAASETLLSLGVSQLRTDTALKAITDSQANLQTLLTILTQSANKYIDDADARMRRIEENLDGLTRTIAVEHRNGKTQQG